MDTLLQDIRFAVRALRRSPAFALVAIITLALGIGANAAIFSLVNAVFFRPLPAVHEPERLVRIFGGSRENNGSSNPLSYPDYQELAGSGRGVFAGVAAFGSVSAAREGGAPVVARAVSGNYFGVLGTSPALGRAISPADDEAGAAPAVVVSHDLWERELGGRSDVVGTPLKLNGQSFTIVGVAPAGFVGTEVEARVEVWLPIHQAALLRGLASDPSLNDHRALWLLPMARLLPGATEERMRASLAATARRLDELSPQADRHFAFRAFPGGTLVSPRGAPEVMLVFSLLMVVVGAVLCVACANVANLLLARAAARRREIAVRLSLGAGRGRLMRQFMTESVVLAAAGGVAGLGLAQLAPALFRMLEMPSTFDYSLDGRVLLHALLVTLATALLFGVAPAVQAVRGISTEALRDSAPGGGRFRSRLRSVLTASQVALSLALLVAATLLLRSLWTLQGASVPYRESGVTVTMLDVGGPGEDAARQRLAVERLLASAGTLPGVEGAAFSAMVPMGDMTIDQDWSDPAGDAAPGTAAMNVVSPGYFAVLGLPLRAGRAFTEADRSGGAPVALVSESMAQRLWPGRNPLGQRVRRAGERPVDYEVIGVVPDVVYARASGRTETVYLSWAQADPGLGSLQLRVRPGTTALEPAIQHAAEVAGVGVFGIRTLGDIRRDAALPQRLSGVLLGLFGAIALVLAAVGLYGVVAYGVAQRTREIGVRVALGARPRDVSRLVVGQGVRMAGVGVAVGVVLALGLGLMLRSLLYGVSAADPLTFAGVATLLLAVAASASWIPARRAARLEPMHALRAE